jgi:hypothetical protein
MRGAVVVLVTALFAGPAPAQSGGTPFGHGTHYFRFILKQNGAVPLRGPDDLRRNPETKMLIVFGRTQILYALIRRNVLRRFLDNGGRVLLATDWPTSDDVFDEIGVQIGDDTWEMPDGLPNFIYRRSLTNCPLVVDFNRTLTRPGRPSAPFFGGNVTDTGRAVTSIATNRPSEIIRTEWYLPVATLFRPGRFFSYIRGVDPVKNQTQLGAVSVRPLWRGGVFALADHSIFINDMMSQEDNDNPHFAHNVVRWLTEDGKRKELLFYEDGEVVQTFDVPLAYPPTPPLPPLEALVPLVNEAIVGLERQNAFNTLLLQVAGGPRPILRTLAFLLTLGLLLFGLYRFLHSRYRPEARVPRLPAQLSTLAPAVPTVERRHQAVIAQGNLAEAARELAHQAFASLGLSPAPDVSPPAVAVTGSRWERFRGRRRAREVRDLWNLAARGPRRRISPAALQRLSQSLHDLLAAVAAGKLRLAGANSPI